LFEIDNFWWKFDLLFLRFNILNYVRKQEKEKERFSVHQSQYNGERQKSSHRGISTIVEESAELEETKCTLEF